MLTFADTINSGNIMLALIVSVYTMYSYIKLIFVHKASILCSEMILYIFTTTIAALFTWLEIDWVVSGSGAKITEARDILWALMESSYMISLACWVEAMNSRLMRKCRASDNFCVGCTGKEK